MPVRARTFLRRNDHRLDQQAHERHRVIRAEVGGSQQLREMQAYDRAECEHPAKSRQDTAPPAGSESGGVVVAEHLVDSLFEH
jgi:hypothetical protein